MDIPIVKPLVLLSYLFLILMGLLVPSSGSHAALHPKSVAFATLAFVLTLYFLFIKRSITQAQLSTLFSFFVFLAFTTMWLLLGLFHLPLEPLFPFDQFKLFIITSVVLVASLLLYQEKTLTFSLFLKTLLYGNGFYIFFKLCVVATLLFRVVTFEKLIDLLGIRAMGMAIFGDFQRFQTSMDIATPFLIFFCLEAARFKVKLHPVFRMAFSCLGFLSQVISFSRVLIFISLVSFFCYFCLHSVRHFLLGIALFTAALIGFVLLIGPHNAQKMVEVRLFSKENSASDEVRGRQIAALTEELMEQPLFGMGMGGYSDKDIRDNEWKHSYEVQWVALLSQLGFIGILFLALPVVLLTVQFLLPPLSREMGVLALLWSGWIAAGFTNPFVISLTSGIMYALFALAYLQLKRKDDVLA